MKIMKVDGPDPHFVELEDDAATEGLGKREDDSGSDILRNGGLV